MRASTPARRRSLGGSARAAAAYAAAASTALGELAATTHRPAQPPDRDDRTDVMTLLYRHCRRRLRVVAFEQVRRSQCRGVAKALKVVGGVARARRGRRFSRCAAASTWRCSSAGRGAWLSAGAPFAGPACRPATSRDAGQRVAGALGDDRDGARPRQRRHGRRRSRRRLAGRRLDASIRPRSVASTANAGGPTRTGVRLLEAYLDRRFPGWREHAERDTIPGDGRRVRRRAR